jgi:hypothetical protein
MSMVSALAVSMYACLRLGFRARDSATNALGPVRAATAALDLIQHDLESALPPNGVMAGPFIGEQVTEGGITANGLQMFCMGEGPYSPDPTGQGGMRKVELVVTAGSDPGGNGTSSPALARYITTNLLAPATPVPQQEVLCRGLRSFSLRYYDGTAWQTSWDSTQQGDVLPAAVEVSLELNWPPDKTPGAQVYKATRVIVLPCHQEPATTSAGSGSGSGSSGGTGGAP